MTKYYDSKIFLIKFTSLKFKYLIIIFILKSNYHIFILTISLTNQINTKTILYLLV